MGGSIFGWIRFSLSYGDVIAMLDSTGTAVVKYCYDAYGNCTCTYRGNSDLASTNPIRYRSYYFDEDTGLYYLNARYYNPQWRRFISPDDTAYFDPESVNGLNLYAYCLNDPVNYADPSGNSVMLVLTGAFVVGAITGAIVSTVTQLVENKFDVSKINPWILLSYTLFGGVSGVLAASGAGMLTSAILSASLNCMQVAVNSAILGEDLNASEALVAAAIGFVSGFIPKSSINAKEVSGKWSVFTYNIKNAVGNRRYVMYNIKKSKLIKEVAISGGVYIISSIVSSVAAYPISNIVGRY